MNRKLAIILAAMAISASGHAQMKILPREKVDSMVRAQQMPRSWSASFLHFDRLMHNAGKVSEKAKPIEAEFRFRNTGREALKIGRISTSCSCVKAEVSPSFIKPGQSATLRAVYNQKGHTGRHPRYISIHLAEPVDTVIATVVIEAIVTE